MPVAADAAVTVTLILSDGNSEPLSLSAQPLPADSGQVNEYDGSRAAGCAQRGRSRAHWIIIPEEPHKN